MIKVFEYKTARDLEQLQSLYGEYTMKRFKKKSNVIELYKVDGKLNHISERRKWLIDMLYSGSEFLVAWDLQINKLIGFMCYRKAFEDCVIIESLFSRDAEKYAEVPEKLLSSVFPCKNLFFSLNGLKENVRFLDNVKEVAELEDDVLMSATKLRGVS